MNVPLLFLSKINVLGLKRVLSLLWLIITAVRVHWHTEWCHNAILNCIGGSLADLLKYSNRTYNEFSMQMFFKGFFKGSFLQQTLNINYLCTITT